MTEPDYNKMHHGRGTKLFNQFDQKHYQFQRQLPKDFGPILDDNQIGPPAWLWYSVLGTAILVIGLTLWGVL